MAPINARISEIVLPVVHDSRGDLTFIEGENQIPFKIARVYTSTTFPPVQSELGAHILSLSR